MEQGYTLMHEHTTLDLSGIKRDDDCRLDCFEETVKELRELYQYGVRTILDVTNTGMGRNIRYMEAAARASGIRILPCTGFYKEPFLPPWVCERTAAELAEFMVGEITQGIEGNSLRAWAVGEVGTGRKKMGQQERKVLDAAAQAAVRTGVAVTTHTTLGTLGREQAEFLTERGVSPSKIVIGHMDLAGKMEAIYSVLETGVNVGFDTVGKEHYCPDAFRIKALKEIQDRGMISQVVLSMDITRKSHLKYRGGLGYAYLFTDFLPAARAHGVTAESIDRMLIHNPRRILEGG
ncbi:MAG: phosphotriesterase-related protein [Hungatella sp.]|nr:phosphotriesterase-related protein [Hungatella sp.]